MPANKNQHYIPIKLLREFLIPGENIRTYKHRRGVEIRPVSIRGLFSKDYYYDKEDSEEYADDIITDGENKYVNKLLPILLETNGRLSLSNKKLATDFMAHFLLRRSLNRDLILKTVEYYYLDKKDLDNSYNILMSLVDSFTTDPLLNLFIRKEDFRQYLLYFAFGIECLKNVNSDHSELKRQSKSVHNKIIISEDSHEIMSGFCREYNWEVITSDIDLILGDAICFFGNEDGTFSFFDSKQTRSIFMPISSRKMLVGFKGEICNDINFRQLNYHNSCCSYKEFICCSRTAESENLVNCIGLDFKRQQNKFIQANNVIVNDELKFYFSQIEG